MGRTGHTTIVVQMPASGDDVQAIKAGILEIADVLVVNKADLPGAESTVEALQAMLDLGSARTDWHHGELLHASAHGGDDRDPQVAWRPPVLTTSAIRGEGIDDLIDAVRAHRQYQSASGLKAHRDRERATAELRRVLRHILLEHLLNQIPDRGLERSVERIVTRELDPYSAARELILEGGLMEERG